MKTNCPNCGAPITQKTCEYCGTSFEGDYSHNSDESELFSFGVTAEEMIKAVEKFAKVACGNKKE